MLSNLFTAIKESIGAWENESRWNTVIPKNKVIEIILEAFALAPNLTDVDTDDTERLLGLIHIHRGKPLNISGLGGARIGDEVIVKGDYKLKYPSWNGIVVSGTAAGMVLVYDTETENVYELAPKDIDY